MTVLELGNKLREMYETKGANKAAMIHLFGIIYAEEMRNASIKPLAVVIAAKLQKSYQAEVNKGMNLSTYVELAPRYKGMF